MISVNMHSAFIPFPYNYMGDIAIAYDQEIEVDDKRYLFVYVWLRFGLAHGACVLLTHNLYIL